MKKITLFLLFACLLFGCKANQNFNKRWKLGIANAIMRSDIFSVVKLMSVNNQVLNHPEQQKHYLFS
jgi:hypothetical protein